MLPVLSLLKLRVANIIDQPAQLALVAQSSSIREKDIVRKGEVAAKAMFEAFLSMHLVKLTVWCAPWTETKCLCPFEDPEITDSGSDVIAKCVPHLKSLHVGCPCHIPELPAGRETLMWKALLSFNTLEELTIGYGGDLDEIPAEGLRFLSTLPSVRMVNVRNMLQLASRIRNSVSICELHNCSFNYITAEQVLGLPNFPRLQVLCCKVIEGASVNYMAFI